jgi:hypothetical protein
MIHPYRRYRNLSGRKKVVSAFVAGAMVLSACGGAFAYIVVNQTTTQIQTVGNSWTWTTPTVTGAPLAPGVGTQSITSVITPPASGATATLNLLVATVDNDGSGNIENMATGSPVPLVGCLAAWYQVQFTSVTVLTGGGSWSTPGTNIPLPQGFNNGAGNHPTAATVTFTASMPTNAANQAVCLGAAPEVTLTAS